jgi:hypothetical protein
VGLNATGLTTPDIVATYATEKSLATAPASLVARLNTLLTCGQMSPALQQLIATTIGAVAIPAGANVTPAQIDTALANRVRLAVLLTMASPEYLAQR